MIELMAKLNRSTLIIVLSLFSTLCSVVIVHGLFISLGVDPGVEELIVSIISPLLIAPVVCWWLTNLIYKLKHLEQELRSSISKEKEAIYLASIIGAQHVTNNLLNQLQLVELEINKQPSFDKEIAKCFVDMQAEANGLMKKLSSVKEIEADKIKSSVDPRPSEFGVPTK